MKRDVIVKKSKINKRGLFAARNFSKDEIVLRWNPQVLKKDEVNNLRPTEKGYIYKPDKNRYFLMQPPERYVNHSCEPNTKIDSFKDIAIRDIKKGEEITSNYGNSPSVSFECNCGSKKCRRVVY